MKKEKNEDGYLGIGDDEDFSQKHEQEIKERRTVRCCEEKRKILTSEIIGAGVIKKLRRKEKQVLPDKMDERKEG